MSKKIIVICCLMLFAFSGYAQNKKGTKAAETWVDAVVKTKKAVGKEMGGCNMPVSSKVMRLNMPAQKLVADLTGLNELVLYTWGTEDGNNWDHSAWADAKLITADGKTVWLDELDWKYAKAPHGSPMKNKNFSGGKITINGKRYDHGLMVHADGEVVFDLGKKYKRFEAEVGIDDGSTSTGSAVFKVQNLSGRNLLAGLDKQYKQEIAGFAALTDVQPEIWLSTPDATVENGAVRYIIRDFPDKQYFEQQLEQLQDKEAETQIRGCIALAQQAAEIAGLCEQLQWVNLKAMCMALDDMKKNPAFDAAKYGQKLKEIEATYAGVVRDIYKGDPKVAAQAKTKESTFLKYIKVSAEENAELLLLHNFFK